MTDVTPVSFARFAGACAVGLGAGGIAYSIAFVILLESAPKSADVVSNVFLLGGGVAATAVFVGLYERLRSIEPGFALWAALLGVGGALGSAAHGGYRLANLIKTPAGLPKNVPSSTDPRGLATFALAALAIAGVSWLILRGGGFPRLLGYLGLLDSLLLLGVYVGRLIVFNPKSPGLLVAALLLGFVVNPAWYLWIGFGLWREREPRGAYAPARN